MGALSQQQQQAQRLRRAQEETARLQGEVAGCQARIQQVVICLVILVLPLSFPVHPADVEPAGV